MRPSTLQLLFFSSFFSCLNERGIEAMVLVRSSTLSKHDGCVCVGPLTPAHTSADRAARRGGGFRRVTEPPPALLVVAPPLSDYRKHGAPKTDARSLHQICMHRGHNCVWHPPHLKTFRSRSLSLSLSLNLSLYISLYLSLFIGLSE